ncbi:MAG: hypothetical protein GXO16_08775 [Epsilonproteobacteria bacterium]|nr:hypothetical protein [Campylobacterota bacterium]
MEALKRLSQLVEECLSLEIVRKRNIERVKELFERLGIDEKVERFGELFEFNAINVTGLSLQPGTLLQIQKGRYLQIIGIKKVEGRSKNINLRYFGKVEKCDPKTIEEVGEFIIRWRLEKSFLGVDHYKGVLDEFGQKVGRTL